LPFQERGTIGTDVSEKDDESLNQVKEQHCHQKDRDEISYHFSKRQRILFRSTAPPDIPSLLDGNKECAYTSSSNNHLPLLNLNLKRKSSIPKKQNVS
jgi:hypothetical protein